jgi:hypothetical protein
MQSGTPRLLRIIKLLSTCLSFTFLLNVQNGAVAEDRPRHDLRTPETAVERSLADRIALARAGVSGSAASAADPGVTLLIAIDIATWTSGELRPAAFERPIGWWRRRLCHARCEEKNKENYGNG